MTTPSTARNTQSSPTLAKVARHTAPNTPRHLVATRPRYGRSPAPRRHKVTAPRDQAWRQSLFMHSGDEAFMPWLRFPSRRQADCAAQKTLLFLVRDFRLGEVGIELLKNSLSYLQFVSFCLGTARTCAAGDAKGRRCFLLHDFFPGSFSGTL